MPPTSEVTAEVSPGSLLSGTLPSHGASAALTCRLYSLSGSDDLSPHKTDVTSGWSFFVLELAFTVDESFSILSLPDSSVT
jgi:hypothetical protein